jgi:hypothetical protein
MGFEQRASCLLRGYSTIQATTPALFHVGYFWDRDLRIICLGWFWTMLLLISASWVARITGMSHWCPAFLPFVNSQLCVSISHGPGEILSFLGLGPSLPQKGAPCFSTLWPSWVSRVFFKHSTLSWMEVELVTWFIKELECLFKQQTWEEILNHIMLVATLEKLPSLKGQME